MEIAAYLKELAEEEDTLEETFYDFCLEEAFRSGWEPGQTLMEAYTGRSFAPGQIVMASTAKSVPGPWPNSDMPSPHRMYLLTAEAGEPGSRKYVGLRLTSNTNKAGVNGGYGSYLYIDDFGSILNTSNYPSKKAVALDIVEPYEFTDEDLEPAGVFKGWTKPAFQKFVAELRERQKRGEDISRYAWLHGEPSYVSKKDAEE